MSPRRRGRRTVTPLRASQTRNLMGNEDYKLSLEVLNRMRGGESLQAAADAVDISPRLVQRYVGSVLELDEDGRWVPLPNDRLYRSMHFLDEQGAYAVEPLDAREASKLGAYSQAVRRYLNTGDDRPLREFRHKRLRTRQKRSLRFVTNLDALDELAKRQIISFEELYTRAM